MGKARKYRAVSFIGNDKCVLPEAGSDERDILRRKLLDAVGNALSVYYSEHPDEADRLLKKPPG